MNFHAAEREGTACGTSSCDSVERTVLAITERSQVIQGSSGQWKLVGRWGGLRCDQRE